MHILGSCSFTSLIHIAGVSHTHHRWVRIHAAGKSASIYVFIFIYINTHIPIYMTGEYELTQPKNSPEIPIYM